MIKHFKKLLYFHCVSWPLKVISTISFFRFFGIMNSENFSDEEYDDYNYQYTIDEDDPAAKYTKANIDDKEDGWKWFQEW